MVKPKEIGSQWTIDPKIYVRPTFQTEYQAKTADHAPEFVYRRIKGTLNNKSVGLQQGVAPYPSSQGFHTTYKQDFVPDKSTLAEGYKKRTAFKVCARVCARVGVCICVSE